MELKAIAVDDEPLALDIIEDYCAKLPLINLVEKFDNPLLAINYLKSNTVDVVFLDIQMDDLTGIQVVELLNNKPYIIFTTAYDSYAVKSYELQVNDYLLKPISLDRFMKAVNKAYEEIIQKTYLNTVKPDTNGELPNEYFFIKTESRIQKVKFNDILYIEGQGDYLQVVTEQEKFMTLMNFKKLEEYLPASEFYRVHKSFMVSLQRINSIERSRIKIGEKIIPISETYKKPFFDFLKEKGLY